MIPDYLKALEERVQALEKTVRQMKAMAKGDKGDRGEDGRDGRDAKQMNWASILSVRSSPVRRESYINVEPAQVSVMPAQVNFKAPDIHVAAPTVNVGQPVLNTPITVNVPKRENRQVKFVEGNDGTVTATLTDKNGATQEVMFSEGKDGNITGATLIER